MIGVTIILAAHGAGDGSPSNEGVIAIARHLERTMVGARVRPAFRKGSPDIGLAIREAQGTRRVVVPMLASNGFHARSMRETLRASGGGGDVIISEVLGATPEIAEGAIAHLRATLVEHGIDPASSSVLCVAHGTARDAGSGTTARTITRTLAAALGIDTCLGFLDDSPDVEVALGMARPAPTLIVLPWLLGGGPHTQLDVPERVHRAAAALNRWRHIVLLDPLGDLDVVGAAVERAARRATGSSKSVRVGARGSALSRRQVELLAALLAPRGIDVSFVAIETAGDRDRTTTDIPSGFFSDEIDAALVKGRIDVALHSAKDVGDAPEGLVDAGFLTRGPVHDVLVSRDRAMLHDLPPFARVGTSCERRARQLRRLRADVQPVPVRGDVPARIDAVDAGEYDAVILASAGLVRLGLEDRISQRFDLAAMMPAAAQGAIVARCRRSDCASAAIAAVDDATTRAAVRAERGFTQELESRGVPIVAAVASAVGGLIVLLGRSIADDGSVTDVVSSGRDASSVARDAVRRWADSRVLTA
ncbi:MAG: hydroxymethylbilane synthase [Gemmatimonadota bacterium]